MHVKKSASLIKNIFKYDFVSQEEKSKRRILSILLVLVILSMFILGTDLIIKGEYRLGAIDIFAGFVLIFILISLLSIRKSIMIYRLGLFLMCALFFYWIKTGAVHGYSSLWLLAFPPFSFFLTGHREGLVWTLVMATLTLLLLINPFSLISVWNYPLEYSIRHLVAFMVISLFSFFYELDRIQFKNAISQEKSLLVIEKEYLAAAKTELEEVNMRLNEEINYRIKTEEELRIHRDNLEDLVNDRTRELKINNLELENSEKRYRLVANNVTDVIWSMDFTYKITFISPSVTSMYGYSVEEVQCTPLESLQPPESIEKVRLELIKQLENERIEGASQDRNVVLHLPQRHKNGTIFDVEIRASFLRDESGMPVGVVGITRDISERVRIQREKEQMQEQLAQAQKMEAIGTLVGGLAHDFNNVLSGIMGSLDLIRSLLKDESLSKREEIDRYVTVGMDSATRSVSLIRDLLSLSRKHETTLEPIDMNDAINHIYDICSNSFPKSIELVFIYSPVRPVIMGDLAQMDQVLLNLCINASHAMTIMQPQGVHQGGKLTVQVDTVQSGLSDKRNEPFKTDADWVRIRITDTGVGMDLDTIAHMYEPFFSRNKPGKGSGLGLSISYNIIRKHGGEIQVRSTPGEGSCFSIYFPLCKAVPSNRQMTETPVNSVRGEGTILVIDDEQMILNVARGYLEKCGYTVIIAGSPDAGIELFSQRYSEISAVIIDLSMPGKTGLEVFSTFRQIDPGVRAILSSGMLDIESKEKAVGMGISDFIEKPYLGGELSAKIKEVISRA